MWIKKLSATRSIHVLKLDFIALNESSWIHWHSFKTITVITLCEIGFDTRNTYPSRVGVSRGFPTPLCTLFADFDASTV